MRLYLIPTPLSAERPYWEYPLLHETIRQVRFFFVEHPTRLRPYLQRLGLHPESQLFGWDSALGDWPWEAYQQVFLARAKAALLSEAGLPGVADAGHTLVRRAHAEGYEVIPLAGPSSITLALAASGLSGQHFTFWGYPPIEKRKRYQFLQKVFQAATESTQILMETPGRTQALFEEILQRAPHTLLLCVAHNLTSPTGFVHTYPIPQWEGQTLPKAPTLFLLGR
ncbi:MAG: SAM-dependent methyltransferase [Bacteroidia bacterium]|jgi:16S rRNA (cytidine1402-2'-O)-methyltransferase|nr:SAM-dependent methyltransferase [Bacteroidia bacterium]